MAPASVNERAVGGSYKMASVKHNSQCFTSWKNGGLCSRGASRGAIPGPDAVSEAPQRAEISEFMRSIQA
ncbi:MAG: hypothetical protein ACREDR_35570, partial [Blastocatellia bacterium]